MTRRGGGEQEQPKQSTAQISPPSKEIPPLEPQGKAEWSIHPEFQAPSPYWDRPRQRRKKQDHYRKKPQHPESKDASDTTSKKPAAEPKKQTQNIPRKQIPGTPFSRQKECSPVDAFVCKKTSSGFFFREETQHNAGITRASAVSAARQKERAPVLPEMKQEITLDDVPLDALLEVLSPETFSWLTQLNTFAEDRFHVHSEIYGSFAFYYARLRANKLSESSYVPSDIDIMVPLSELDIKDDRRQYESLVLMLQKSGFVRRAGHASDCYIQFEKITDTAQKAYENNISVTLQFKGYQENTNGIPLTQHRLQLNGQKGCVSIDPEDDVLKNSLLQALQNGVAEIDTSFIHNPYANPRCYFSRLIKFYFNYKEEFDMTKIRNAMTAEDFLLPFFSTRLSICNTASICYFEMADLIAKGYFCLPEASGIIAAFVKAIIFPKKLSSHAIQEIVKSLQTTYEKVDFNHTSHRDIMCHFYNEAVCAISVKFEKFMPADFKLMAMPLAVKKHQEELQKQNQRLFPAVAPVAASHWYFQGAPGYLMQMFSGMQRRVANAGQ